MFDARFEGTDTDIRNSEGNRLSLLSGRQAGTYTLGQTRGKKPTPVVLMDDEDGLFGKKGLKLLVAEGERTDKSFISGCRANKQTNRYLKLAGATDKLLSGLIMVGFVTGWRSTLRFVDRGEFSDDLDEDTARPVTLIAEADLNDLADTLSQKADSKAH